MKKKKFSTILFVSLVTFIHGLVQDESLITSVIDSKPRETINLDINHLNLHSFNQDTDAVVVLMNSPPEEEQKIDIAVQLLAPTKGRVIKDKDLFHINHSYRSGGLLEINLSDKPNYKLTGCVAAELQLPNITTDESAVELRVVKRYPWFALKYNGVTVVKHNFFSFKNPDCRSVWAIKANAVVVDLANIAELQEKSVLETGIAKQNEDEKTLTDMVYNEWYQKLFYDSGTNGIPVPEPTPTPTPVTSEERICEMVEEATYIKLRCNETDGSITFKCPSSNDYYTYKKNGHTTSFNMSCPNDRRFYQACGHNEQNIVDIINHFDDNGLCGVFLCDLLEDSSSDALRSDSPSVRDKICNGIADCVNTDLDEKNCDFNCKTGNSREQYLPGGKKCNGECDCMNCADEAECGLNTKGVFCEDRTYKEAEKICDHNDDCKGTIPMDERYCIEAECEITLYHNGMDMNSFVYEERLKMPVSKVIRLRKEDNCDGVPRCDDSSDEQLCVTRTCQRTDLTSTKVLTITLNDANLCTTPKSGNLYRICDDASDQTNCTDPADVALLCGINGYESSVSKYAICKGLNLCDDDFENNCIQITEKCLIHKHQFCDGVYDCEGGTDEAKERCQVTGTAKCVRRYPAQRNINLPIVKLWIQDGVVDCVDEVDEDPKRWTSCTDKRVPWATSFTEVNSTCQEFYFCAIERKQSVPFSFLCDKVNSCGRENEVCKSSRHTKELPWTVLPKNPKTSDRNLHFCLPGLENLRLLAGNCTTELFIHPHKPFGVTSHPKIKVPEKALDCRFLFGAPYVFASCSNLCLDGTTLCPLNKLEADSCSRLYQQKERSFTFSMGHKNETYLSFLDTKENVSSSFDKKKAFLIPELFSCPNKRCIPFSKVCNLADDCGDGTDEKNCTNHFKCQNGNEFVLLTNVCNGVFDCSDKSDECNENCYSNLRIIKPGHLAVCGWTIGILAIILNVFAIIATAKQLYGEKSNIKVSNLTFIILIASGDLCVGIYLIAISIIDRRYKADDSGLAYCTKRFDEWLSGGMCTAMGVLSTFGSQLALYAMTVLSMFRAYCVASKSLRGLNAFRVKIALTTSACLLVLAALLTSTVPLMDAAEDFFVNGLVYQHNPLLIGDLDKEKHFDILQAHYGSFYQKGVLSWKTIRALVQDMFTTFNGPIIGKKIHFYGNAGVCLFKYFVRPDDPQQAYTWFMIVQNAICFFIITASYITVHFIVARSAKRSITEKGKGKSSNKNAALNRKIAMMITTDFICWIPFIIICTLHYTECMDATPYYSLFSIVFMPINSVINPLLYDTTGVLELLKSCTLRIKQKLASTSEINPESILVNSKEQTKNTSI
ncbi:hypothetical protein ACHWQZ_G003092 [Mnemiopsis leidyi]